MEFLFIWPGRPKESFVKEGVKKYLDGIRLYARAEIAEIKETKEKPPAEAMREEGRRIIEKAGGPYVLLHEKGRMMDSEGFARFLEKGGGVWRFVVGGPYGVSEDVKKKASRIVSFSPMTFPHELMRVILLEQVYRALTIMKGKGYHHG